MYSFSLSPILSLLHKYLLTQPPNMWLKISFDIFLDLSPRKPLNLLPLQLHFRNTAKAKPFLPVPLSTLYCVTVSSCAY